jgi:hypothetical protein
MRYVALQFLLAPALQAFYTSRSLFRLPAYGMIGAKHRVDCRPNRGHVTMRVASMAILQAGCLTSWNTGKTAHTWR